MGNFPKLPKKDGRPHPGLRYVEDLDVVRDVGPGLRSIPQRRPTIGALTKEGSCPQLPPLRRVDG
eukprot:3017075-Amphidinium_carterae.1